MSGPRVRATLALAAGAVVIVAVARPASVLADPVSGAIFTTVSNGSEVNYNIYPSKDAVYLNGGPGPGAPATAAGLPDGTYVFQVTDPSGRTLLSTDVAACRQFTVSGGNITGVVAAGGCQHVTGTSGNGGIPVQLMPYNNTPNNGGEYKAWATSVANFLTGCSRLGVANGLSVVNCGSASGDVHGFIPSDSKTDNFKVANSVPREIDTDFADAAGNLIDGRVVTWTDPLGASNTKWSYYNAALDVIHQAHVEDVEAGTHLISIANQAGCTVTRIDAPGITYQGPATVSVRISPNDKYVSIMIHVHCA